MVRLGLACIWLLHFLPLAILSRLGATLGTVLYYVAAPRRRVVLLNLQFCFPDLDESARRKLALAHFRAFARSVFEHGILWWGSKARVQALVKVEGLEHWRNLDGKPVILLAPHFIGLDMGGIRLASEYRLNSVYSRTKDEVFDRLLIHGRTRFGQTTLFARQDGIRPMVKTLKRGEPFYYLPDMDLGIRDSVFAPFFGKPAATITGLSRIAQLAGAVPLRDLSAEMAAAPLTVSVADDAHRPAIPVPQPDRTLVYLFGSLALGATVRLAPLAFRPRPESLLTPKRGA